MNLSSNIAERILNENREKASSSRAQSDNDYLRVCSRTDMCAEEPAQKSDEEEGSSDSASSVKFTTSSRPLSGPTPWFRNFRETVDPLSVPGIRRVARIISDARKLPECVPLVRALGARRSHLFEQQVASRRRQLTAEFPFGIAGSRASFDKSPEGVKLCLFGHSVTTEAMGHSRPPTETLDELAGDKERSRGRPRRDSVHPSLIANSRLSVQLARRPSTSAPLLAEKQAVAPNIDLSTFRLRPRYRNSTGLIDCDKLDDELEIAASWTFDEIVSYLKVYATSPKDFKRISTTFPDKTVADCVDFYYRYKLVLGLKLFTPVANATRDTRRGKVQLDGINSSSKQLNLKLILENALAVLEPHVSFGDIVPRDTFRKLPIIDVPRRDPRWPDDEEEERKLMISCLLAHDHIRDMLFANLLIPSEPDARVSSELQHPIVADVSSSDKTHNGEKLEISAEEMDVTQE